MTQNLSPARAMGDARDVKRDVVIKLLVTAAERAALQAAADKESVTLSEFIRSRLLKTTTTVEVPPVVPNRAAAAERSEIERRAASKRLAPKGGK